MTPSPANSAECHVLRYTPAAPAALLAFGDAGLDDPRLRYLALDDRHPLPAAPAPAECNAMRYTSEAPSAEIAGFNFAADSACPSPDRCASSGCRGLCLPPHAA